MMMVRDDEERALLHPEPIEDGQRLLAILTGVWRYIVQGNDERAVRV